MPHSVLRARLAQLEADVFDTLGKLYALPGPDAVGSASAIAQQIFSFIGDAAVLETVAERRAAALSAFRQLVEEALELLRHVEAMHARIGRGGGSESEGAPA